MPKIRISLFVLCMLICLGLGSTSQGQPFQVKSVPGLVYKTVGTTQLKLNLFLPVRADGTIVKGTPLLTNIVGGCFYSGQPGNGGYWTKWKMVEAGYAVASIAHSSLGKGFLIPCPMEDVRAAIRFLRAHAPEYGYDPNRIACMGASSSGVLATIAGISDKHKIFDSGDNLDQSSQVQCVVAFCGTPDFVGWIDQTNGHVTPCFAEAIGVKFPAGLSNQLKAQFDFASDVKKLRDKAARFAPITYVDRDYAPTILLHGIDDPVIPPSQSCLMYETLKRAGVKTELYMYKGGKHSPKTYGPEEGIREPVLKFLVETWGKPF